MMEKRGGTSIKPTGIMPVPNGFKLSSSSITSSSNESTFYNKDTIPFSSSSGLLSSSSSGGLKSGTKTVVLSSHGNKCVMNGNKMLLSSSSLSNSDKVITATSSTWGRATVSKSEAPRNGSLTISSRSAGLNDLASEKLRSNSNSVSMSADESSDQNGNNTFGDTSVFSISSVESMGLPRIADDSGTLSGENSIDMFAATPAGKLIRQMIITEADSSDSILVPATQPVEDQGDQDSTCKIQIVVDSDQEQLDSPDSSVQHIYIDEEDFPEDEILVPATQAVSQESYDRGSRIEIEESVVTEESSSSDESNQARGNETFTVSPSPMKLSTKRFQKVDKNIPLKLGSVEEESSSQPFNSTFVLAQKTNNHSKGFVRNNCTFSRDTSPVNDLGGDGTINSLQDSSELDENLSQIQEPSLFHSLNESGSSVMEGAPEDASNLDTPIAQNQVETTAQNEPVPIVQDQADSSSQDQVNPSSQDQANPSAHDQVDPVAQDQVVPFAQNQAGPTARKERGDPVAQNKLNLNAVKEIVPPVPSTPNALPLHVIQLSTTPSSPRKGKKLYTEPSFPVKENSAPKSPESSDSEAEQDGEQSLYSRFPHLNNPKRGKDTKADREALFETENPLPSTSAPLVRHNAREEKKKPKGKVSKSESSQVSSKGRRTVRHASKKLLDSKAAKVKEAESVTKPKRKKKKKQETVEGELDRQAEKGGESAEFLDQAFLLKSTENQVSDISKLQTEGAPVHGDAENSDLEMPNLEIATDNRIPAEAKTDQHASPCLQINKNPEQVKPKRPRGRPALKTKTKKPVASKSTTERQSNHAYLEELPDLSDDPASDYPTPADPIPAAKSKGRPKRKKIDIVDLTDESEQASAEKKTKELPQLVLELEPPPPTPPKSKSNQEKNEEKSEVENGEKPDQKNGEKSDPQTSEKSNQQKSEKSDQQNGENSDEENEEKSEQEQSEVAATSRPRTKRLRKPSSSDNKVTVPEGKRSRKGGKKPGELVISASPPPPTPPKPKSEQDNDVGSSRPGTKRVRKPSTSEDKTVPEVKKSKKGSKKPAEIIVSSSPPPPTPPRGRNPKKNNKKDVPAQEPVPIVVDDNNPEVRRSGRVRKPRELGEGFVPLAFRL